MAEPATAVSGLTSGSLAEMLGAELVGRPDMPIAGLNSLHEATREQLTFIGDAVHAARWAASAAGTAVVTRGVDVPGHDPATRALILVANADHAMIAALERFAPADVLPEAGIHPSACVHPTAQVGAGVRMGPGVTVAERAVIGEGCVLHANAAVYADAQIGARTTLHAGAVVRERCVVGKQCILGANSVVGGDGFGYRPSADGRSVVRVPHLGNVVLEDMVEIGSCTTIDRGKFGATRIGVCSKLDNLVQIGHNVTIGRMCMLSGQVGVAGSTQIGDGVLIGGGAGLADHLRIGDRVRIAARAAVMNDIPTGETWGGYPAQDVRLALREVATLRKLVDWAKQIRKLLDDAGAKT